MHRILAHQLCYYNIIRTMLRRDAGGVERMGGPLWASSIVFESRPYCNINTSRQIANCAKRTCFPLDSHLTRECMLSLKEETGANATDDRYRASAPHAHCRPASPDR